ncbi:MAG: S8 family serine peptidase [Phycisphaerae bacterium]|jgi:subtilisin family serine protease|nr:S8 family serine peptidase [Phycisphaerae bacterium]
MRFVASLTLSITFGLTSAIASAQDSAERPDGLIGGVEILRVPMQPQLDPRMQILMPDAIEGEQVEATPLIVPNEFIVRFTSDASAIVRAMQIYDLGLTGFAPLDDLAQAHGIVGYRQLFPGSNPVKDILLGGEDMSGWFVLTLDLERTTLADAMSAFAGSAYADRVEEIGIHPVFQVPNDSSYSSQWFLNQTSDKDIDAPEGWDISTGSTAITVAVLDTGVRYFHKDLGGASASYSNPSASNGNIWINAAEKNGAAGFDDDGNGYTDDWVGYDFVTAPALTCWNGEDCSGADNDPRDFNGHGTHCSGIVSAMNNNGYGVASPSGGWGSGTNSATGNGVKVMCLRIGHSAKYFNQEVGVVRMDSAASAFYYAANNGAKIASCSWGSSNSGGLGTAVTFFINAGGLVFKAAGNSNNQSADYLCSRSDVYSVASTDQLDKKSSFSSYGTWVDISAPGSSITSTYHNHASPSNDYVVSMSGTSMATPLVASVAAAVWSKHPTWTRTEVWNTVKNNVDSISAQNPSYAGKLGSGRVNLQKALVP